MAVQPSNNDRENNIPNKLTAATLTRRPLTFYDGERHAFVPVDPEIIDKLRLTHKDEFTQEIQGENILMRRYKETI